MDEDEFELFASKGMHESFQERRIKNDMQEREWLKQSVEDRNGGSDGIRFD